MTTSITVKIDSDLVEKAKKYARKKKTSIDKIFERQIKELLKQDDDSIAPEVQELAGILNGLNVKDEKKEFRKNQLNKHRA